MTIFVALAAIQVSVADSAANSAANSAASGLPGWGGTVLMQ